MDQYTELNWAEDWAGKFIKQLSQTSNLQPAMMADTETSRESQMNILLC